MSLQADRTEKFRPSAQLRMTPCNDASNVERTAEAENLPFGYLHAESVESPG